MCPPRTKRVLLFVRSNDYRKIVQLGLSMTTDWELLPASSIREAQAIAADSSVDTLILDGDLEPETIQALLAIPSLQTCPIIAIVEGRTANSPLFGAPNVTAVLSKLSNPLSLPEQIAQALNWPMP